MLADHIFIALYCDFLYRPFLSVVAHFLENTSLCASMISLLLSIQARVWLVSFITRTFGRLVVIYKIMATSGIRMTTEIYRV